jgi:tetratricopeptide (TPR) repeat protein
MLATIQNHNVQAEKECLEALRLSQEIGNLWGQSYAYYTLGFLYTHQSRFAEALEVTQNALRLVEPSGFVVPLVDCNTYTAWIYGYLGDYEQGKSFALAALQHAKERLPAMQVGPTSILAILEYWQGNTEKMDEWLMAIDLSVMVTSYTSFERFLAECYRSYAAGDHEQVLRQTEEMLPRIQSYKRLAPLGPIHCVNGMSLLALNRLDEARDWLNQAQVFSSDTPHEKIDNLVAFSRLESLLGNDEAAKAHLVEAWQNVEIVLRNVDDPALRASYLARPQIRTILDEAGEFAALL